MVGAIWLLAAILSIAAAFALQPVGDWGTFPIILAILMAILGITGAWMLVTGRGQIVGTRMSVKGQRILSIIGLVGATILVIGYLVGDWANWTAQDALTIGIWVAVGAMFAAGRVITSKSS